METAMEQQSRLLGYSPVDSNSDGSIDFSCQEKLEKQFDGPRKSRFKNLRSSFIIHACLIIGYTILSGGIILYMKKQYASGPGIVYCRYPVHVLYADM